MNELTRRGFLRTGAATAIGGALAAGSGSWAASESATSEWNREVLAEQARYADNGLPEIPFPHFEGERYETEAPDTLDLADRAEFAMSAITSMLDADRDCLMFGLTWFNRRPPIISIKYPEENLSCGHKHLEALPLLRMMSGSSFNLDVDRNFMQSMLRMTAPDGVIYMPYSKAALNPLNPPPFLEPFASVEGEGRDILALCMWYQHDQNPLWKILVEKKIKRLSEIAVQEGDYAYFNNRPYHDPNYGEVYFTLADQGPFVGPTEGPPRWWQPLKKAPARQGRFRDPQSAHQVNFMLSRSLCVYYRITGFEPALDLAGMIIRGARNQRKGFDEDGRWLLYHFHTSTASLLAMLDYAVITHDVELLDYVKRAFEYGRQMGGPEVGFFPELVPGSDRYVGRKEVNTCETCEVADMIGLALKLTHAGTGDYWNDVECWVRNQYAENQLLRLDWLDTLDPDAFKFLPGGKFEDKPVQPWESSDIKRALGGFAGWSLANDYGSGQQHMCCTGNASRTLYWVWDSILSRQDESVRVNLLLNRASPWLDVNSHLPNQGKVELKIKHTREAAVRIPEGVERIAVICKVNGRQQPPSWAGNYVIARDLARGDTVTVEFPMRERTEVKLIGEFPYRLTLRGNTVVDIEPKGRIAPNYQRANYRTPQAKMKKVTRFVSRENVLW